MRLSTLSPLSIKCSQSLPPVKPQGFHTLGCPGAITGIVFTAHLRPVHLTIPLFILQPIPNTFPKSILLKIRNVML